MKNLLLCIVCFTCAISAAVAQERIVAGSIRVVRQSDELPCAEKKSVWDSAQNELTQSLVSRETAKSEAESAANALEAARAALLQAEAADTQAKAALEQSQQKVAEKSAAATAAYSEYVACLVGE